ncbi:MAG TPA: PEP-CTERM sorting domain-containing protein [Micropepsaceae bacterium]|nr:PEP-CTERM sorting domain-containing protein [Micropepsaceae bacterium]
MNIRFLLLAGLLSTLAIDVATNASAIPTCTPGTGVDTLSNCLGADLNTAKIVNAPDGLGGVRFNVGFASGTDQFNGYVDNFHIAGLDTNDTLFNFDPNAAASVPEPATVALFGAGLVALAWLLHRRKRHKD